MLSLRLRTTPLVMLLALLGAGCGVFENDCDGRDAGCEPLGWFPYLFHRCPAIHPALINLPVFGQVSTFAGQAGSPGGTDGTGTAAQFQGPNGMTGDGYNIYMVEGGGHRVRRIHVASAAVALLAGTGVGGSADGPQGTAQFQGPTAITTDCTNLYVTDGGNHTIRTVSIANGYTTTLAGQVGVGAEIDGVGTAAAFNNPRGITTDSANLYVSDFMGHTVRRVDLGTARVTTIAGQAGVPGTADGPLGTNLLDGPAGLALDGRYLYLTNYNRHTLRRLDLVTLELTTVAGLAGTSGSTDGVGLNARFNQPLQLFRDRNYIYATEMGNNIVRRISLTDIDVQTLAGLAPGGATVDGFGSAASFNGLTGIASSYESLFVGEFSSHVMRKIQ